jgi:uncharacterized BrkB/YihY/UPF0761 family membrane protein
MAAIKRIGGLSSQGLSTCSEQLVGSSVLRAPKFRQLCWPQPRELAALMKETVVGWNDDNVPRLGAALAFYTLLSLAPLLVVVVAIAAIAYGKQAAQGQLFWQIRDLVGTEGARAIQGVLEGAYKPGTGALATGLGPQSG